jgi:hypothetical protein
MPRKKFTKRETATKYGFRSGLELDLDESLKTLGIDGEYEKNKIIYTQPETQHTYTPDFRLPNGIYVETKGRFVMEDRKKHILIKQQHPELDIRFVFQNSKNKIRKGSKTTYGDWCDKYGFKYADKTIPSEWLSSN